MRLISCVLAVVLSLCGGAAAGAQTFGPDSARVLSLSFDQDGRITLAAKNVSMREILAEWARQCGCYVVNADKLTGAALPYPLLYEHETQGRVLASLLRQASGYVLTPQRAGVLSRSNFETIYILPTSTAVASSSSSFAPSSVPAPAYPMPTPGGPDDELPPIVPMAMPGPGALRPPVGAPVPPGFEPGYAPASQAPASNVPSPRPPGTATTFVPIVPVGTSQSTSPSPSAAAPGSAPGQPVPMVIPGR